MSNELLPTVVRKYLALHPEMRLECAPVKPWYKSKRVWSAVALALSGSTAILTKVAHGNEGVEVAAIGCSLAAGLINVLFGLKDSGTAVTMPDAKGFVQNAAAQSKTVQDFRAVMGRMSDALNRNGKGTD